MSEASEIFGELPSAYQDQDQVLAVLARLVAPKLQEFADRSNLDAIFARFDPDTCADADLPGLLKMLWREGSPWLLSPFAQRRILKRAPHWIKSYPQPGVIPEIIKYYFEEAPGQIGPTIILKSRGEIRGGTRFDKIRFGKSRFFALYNRHNVIATISSLGTQTSTPELHEKIRLLLLEVLPPMQDLTFRSPF